MNYTADSIKTMEFGEAASKRIGMYLSADLEEAVFLGLREIISNSVDEYLQGYGKKIVITIDTKNQYFTVADEGRGIPVGIRPDGTNSLVAALTLPHTGGKLDNEIYNSAIGTNGIGASVVTHTAEQLIATVYRDGKEYNVEFGHTDKGAKIVSGVSETAYKGGKTGTVIAYKPSKDTYQGSKLNIKHLKEYLNELQYLTPGLEIYVDIDGEATKYYSANGLSDALDSTTRIHKNPFVCKSVVDSVQIEFALQWAKEGNIKYYANSLHMPDGGAFVTGFKTSMTKAFNTCAEKEFKGDLIRKYLTGFISIKVKTPQFSNQAKTSLANPEARTAVAKFTTDAVKQFFTKYPNDLASIVKIIETEQKAEDAAQRAREAADKIKSGGKSLNALKDLPSKLADCNQFGGELFIVEGDSAGGSAKSARDPNTQAIMPIRGKILNTTTKDLAKILENREVRDIVTALGTGVGERFNIRNLRYDKIIIMTDADSDGGHIALLLCSLFLYHLPQIVLQNKLYKAVSPLYSVQKGSKLVYLYDDKELQEYIKKNGKPPHINRYKGLGEMDAKQLWETTMNPVNRRLQPLGTEDLEKTLELFDQLMGDDAKLRKAYIIENAEEGDL